LPDVNYRQAISEIQVFIHFLLCALSKGKEQGVNFTNILRADFVLMFFCQKSAKLKCKYKKAVRETFAQKKLCAKCW
jgi:hypothetical protein